jgi:hypothetical protein
MFKRVNKKRYSFKAFSFGMNFYPMTLLFVSMHEFFYFLYKLPNSVMVVLNAFVLNSFKGKFTSFSDITSTPHGPV